jgi:NodT family efflux transporter outer membrane factor (OMF) lipoprotein
MMRRRVVISALLALSAAGCMVGPDYKRPDVETPEGFGEMRPAAEHPTSLAAPDPVQTDWWTTFRDPMLTSLVERAVQANLDLVQAEARVRQSRAARRIASADLWPQIEASGSYTRVRTSSNGPALATPGKWYNLFQAGFDANWEVDVFGGNRRAVEAADANVEASIADRDAVLVSLVAEVGLEYVTYRSLQQRIALADRNVRSQQDTFDLTRRLFNAGLAPELDVTRAEAQVATTASTIPTLKLQAAQTMHRLSVLLAQPPMSLEQELASTAPIPQPPPAVGVGLPSDLLLRRPDVARAERLLAAATADIGVATRDLYPRFFITGAASLQSVKASDFFDWESRAISLGPSISWPVFQGGRIKANIELQTAAQQESLAAYRATILQAFQDTEDSLVAYAQQQENRAQLERAVQANQRAADVARNSYAQGLTDFLTVLVAEQSLFTSQDTLAQSRRDLALDLVALYKAVGGGWESQPQAQVASAAR